MWWGIAILFCLASALVFYHRTMASMFDSVAKVNRPAVAGFLLCMVAAMLLAAGWLFEIVKGWL